jgi:hypothetical protein
MSGSAFCVVVAWHCLRDSTHQLILRNAPWFVIFGLLVITVTGIGTFTCLGLQQSESNAQLRKDAIAFASKLRRFDLVFQVKNAHEHEQEINAIQQMIPESDKNEAGIDKRWAAILAADAADNDRRARHQAEFNETFRSGVLHYKSVICRKVEINNPCPQDRRANMIDYGRFVGSNPISEFADYLESITDLLPTE